MVSFASTNESLFNPSLKECNKNQSKIKHFLIVIANSFYLWLTSDYPQNIEIWLQFGVMIYESWILI